MKHIVKLMLIAIVATALFGKVYAKAEETETPYSYGFVGVVYTNYPSNRGLVSEEYIGSFSSNYPCWVLIYDDTATNRKVYQIQSYGNSIGDTVITDGMMRHIVTYENEAYTDKDDSCTQSMLGFIFGAYNDYGGSMSTDMPIFRSKEDAMAYYENGDDSGMVNRPDIDLESEGVYSSTLEIPRLNMDANSYNFTLDNATENLYMEMRGRWYTVDDIELFKEDAMWKYRYNTIHKSDLTTWISANEKRVSTGTFNMREIGLDAFDQFLAQHPVDGRTFSGGSNSIGNYLFGYNDALETIKLLLSTPESIYNGVEVYVRYFYYDENGIAVYSRWTHFYDNLATQSGSSGSRVDDMINMYTESQSQVGLTDTELNEMESSGTSREDADVVSTYRGETTQLFDNMDMSNFSETLRFMVESIQDFPVLVAKLFGWMPPWAIAMIGIAIGATVLLRFLGR